MSILDYRDLIASFWVGSIFLVVWKKQQIALTVPQRASTKAASLQGSLKVNNRRGGGGGKAKNTGAGEMNLSTTTP
jgi:hypothetical protein